MTDQHPTIDPPRELMQQWREQVCFVGNEAEREEKLMERAFSEGYDQRGEVNEAKLRQARDKELEACCEWLDYNCPSVGAHHLRSARRPELSPKAQARKLLEHYSTSGEKLTVDQFYTALRALEDEK